jgi:hypothetical protein
MNCTKLMVIRHAEKPEKQTGVFGVTEAGARDKDELTPKGWQRAGALVRFFNPVIAAGLRAGMAVPGAIFAARATSDNPSKRAVHTVRPLATDLRLGVCADFALHQEKDLVDAAMNAAAAVLICWHHERIPKLVARLGVEIGDWPDAVYDRVLILDRAKDAWSLSVLEQHLLSGDS